MPPFRKMLCKDHLGADDFVGPDMEPIEITMTLTGVNMAKPPAGGKEKALFSFKETPKTAFLKDTAVTKIGRDLRRRNTEDWIGAKVTITSAPTKMAGKPTTGMIVVKAWLDRAPSVIPGAPVVTDGE